METIKSSAEISELFQHGRRLNGSTVMLIVSRRNERHGQHGRAAFIAGKRLGNAVWRNAAKRRMRAISRDLEGCFDGYDVAFVARRSILKVPFARVEESVRRQSQRLQAGREERR